VERDDNRLEQERQKQQLKVGPSLARFSLLRIASYAAFLAFVALLMLLSYQTPLEGIDYGTAVIAAAFFFVGVRLRAFDPISAAWLILGADFTLSFIAISPYATSVGVVLVVTALLLAYDLTRFSTAMEPIVSFRKSRSIAMAKPAQVVSAYAARFGRVGVATAAISAAFATLFQFLPPVPGLGFADAVVLGSVAIVLAVVMMWTSQARR
jgi:hypothetical protein